MQIHLIEASSKLLNGMSEHASRKATYFLKNMGVNIWTDTKVESYNGEIAVTSKEIYATQTLIWAAGVKGAAVPGLEKATVINGRLKVNAYNQVEGYEDIFSAGDVALMTTDEYPEGLPMLGSVAQQQGKHLSKNLKRLFSDQKLLPFHYKDMGTMATIGRNKAVVDLPNYSFSGFFAWMAWMFVHLMLLADFRSRIVVFVNWTWSYIRFDKGTRLIIRKYEKKPIKESEPIYPPLRKIG
ncbi:MAG: FAD-dependent oxidoreductase [Flavobacteriales bacterium]|nr:FAD-dependent oxidoreductase [Flavobacteriales bacterium]